MTTPFTFLPISHMDMDCLRTKEAELLDKELEADRIWRITHERDQNFNKMVSRQGVIAVQEFFEEGYTYFGSMLPVYWSRFNGIRMPFLVGVRTDLLEERPELAMMALKLKFRSANSKYDQMAIDFATKKLYTDRRGYEYLWQVRMTPEGLECKDWKILDDELMDRLDL